jgi:predicted TIM-barrel fold metal-dependent hydrolase
MPAEPQRPLYLDEVCLFYPDLVIIMAHGADPWWGEAIRLLLKYPNLYMMTSAYAPKYLPPELIRFMDTRGSTKVMFATDYPFLPFDRA